MIELKGAFKQSSFASKFFLLIGATILFTVFSVLLWQIFSNGNVSDISSLKLLQLFQSIGMFVLAPLVLAYFWSEKPAALLFLNKRINWLQLLYVILYMIMIIPAINLLTDINSKLILPKALAAVETWMKASELEMAQLTEKILSVRTATGLIFNLFLVAMIPALGEELFFRATLQRLFGDWKGVKMAIWLTAFVFSAVHMQFYGFVPRLLMGAFFGYLLFWSETLWLPIAAHFVNNGIAVIFFYFKFNGFKLLDIDAVGTGSTLWLGCASGLLAILGFFWLRKQFTSDTKSVAEY